VLPGNIEQFLGMPEAKPNNNHRKPLEILKALDEGKISPQKLAELKKIFESDLLRTV
jgi:hypothetical protein